MKRRTLRRALAMVLCTAVLAASIPSFGNLRVFAEDNVTFSDTFDDETSLANWTTVQLNTAVAKQKDLTISPDGRLVPAVYAGKHAAVSYLSAAAIEGMKPTKFETEFTLQADTIADNNSYIVLYYDRTNVNGNMIALDISEGTVSGGNDLETVVHIAAVGPGITLSKTTNGGNILRDNGNTNPDETVDITKPIKIITTYNYDKWASDRILGVGVQAEYTNKAGAEKNTYVYNFEFTFKSNYTPIEDFSVGIGSMKGDASYAATIFDNVEVIGTKNDSAANEAAADAFRATHSAALSLTIDTVAVSDAAKIDNALSEYKMLSNAVQALLESEKALLDALRVKIYDLEAAAFTSEHSAILNKTVQTVAIDDLAAIEAAQKAFTQLSAQAQERLTDEKALLEALKAQIYLLEANAFKADYSNVLAMDPAAVGAEDADAVNAALEAYGQLSEEAKKHLGAEKQKLDALVTALSDYFISKFKTDHAEILAKDPDTVKTADTAAVDAALKEFALLSEPAQAGLEPERVILYAMKERLIRLSGQKATADDFENPAYTDIVWEDTAYVTGVTPTPHHTAQEVGAVPPNNVLFPASVPAADLATKYVTTIKEEYWPVGKVSETSFRFKLTDLAASKDKHAGGFAAFIDPVTGLYAGLQFSYEPNTALAGSPDVLNVNIYTADDKLIAIHPGGGSSVMIGANCNEYDTIWREISKDGWITVTAKCIYGTVSDRPQADINGKPQIKVMYTIEVQTLDGVSKKREKEVCYIFKDTELQSRMDIGRNGFIRGNGDSCMYDDYTLTMSATAQEYAEAFRTEHAEILAKSSDTPLTDSEKELLELAINAYYAITDADVLSLLSPEAAILKALAVANGGDDPAVLAFREKYKDLLAKTELTVVPEDEPMVDAALAELDAFDVFIKMVLSEEKIKLDLFKQTLLVYVPPRTDPDDMSPFIEDFENDLRQWDRVYQDNPPFPVKDEMQIVADPENPDNNVLYIKANAAVLTPRDILWPDYGAMTKVTYRMRLESLAGNANNKNGTFVSFVDFENYNRIVQGLNPNAQDMPRMQADSVVDGEKSSSRWYDSAPFDPNGGWFDVSIVFSGRNAIVAWTDAEGRSVTCAVTANVAYGVLALGQPAGSQDMTAVWVDDVRVEFTKEDWDVDEEISDIEVYYEGNTFINPGETVLISGEKLNSTIAKVEIMQLDNITKPGTIAYIGEQNFRHLAEAGGVQATWDASKAREVDVVQWTGDSLKFLLPEDYTPGVYAVKLTARNAGAEDVYLYINDPDVDFVMGDEGKIATPGSSARIVGHNLIPHADENLVTVALKAENGTVTYLDVTALKDENTYSLQAEIPANMAYGKYTLYVHSGYGDATAWSTGEPVEIAADPSDAWPKTVFNVRDFGAVGDGKINDTPALVKALEAAAQNGGGVVFLPRGVYRVLNPLVIPENVVFKGEGKEISSIVWSPVRWPYGELPEFLISMTQNVEICDLGLHGTRFKGLFRVYGGLNPDGSLTKKAENVNIHDLRIQFYTRAGYLTEGVQASTGELTMAEVNMLVSKELNQGYFLQPESDVQLHNFKMENIAVDSDVAESDFHRGIHANCHYSVIRNVKFELGWSSMNGFGPMILEECEFENAALVLQGNFYLGNNYMHDLKGNNRELYTSDGTHRVDGAVVKLISNEPGNTVVEFADTNKATPGGMVGWELYVISGQGLGQVRKIVANTDKQITLDEPFAVAPNRNSLIAIHTPRTGSFFVNNTFENGAACGTYGTVINVVYDGNKFLRHGGQVFNVHLGVTWYVSTINGLLDGPFYMHGDGDTSTSPSGSGRYQFLFLYGIRPYSSMGYTFKNNQMVNGCYMLINWLSQSNGTRDFIIEGNLFDEGAKQGIQSSFPSNYGDGILLKDNTFNTDMPYSTDFANAMNSTAQLNKVKDLRYINLDVTGDQASLKGDVNGDGRVSLKDVTMIRYALLEMVTLTSAQIERGDMDGDKAITLMDANTIRRQLLAGN